MYMTRTEQLCDRIRRRWPKGYRASKVGLGHVNPKTEREGSSCSRNAQLHTISMGGRSRAVASQGCRERVTWHLAGTGIVCPKASSARAVQPHHESAPVLRNFFSFFFFFFAMKKKKQFFSCHGRIIRRVERPPPYVEVAHSGSNSPAHGDCCISKP